MKTYLSTIYYYIYFKAIQIIMILYFTGTGNSKYVADKLAENLKDRVYFILNAPLGSLKDGEQLGFVFPVYSWGVPPLIMNYIKSLSQEAVESLNTLKTEIWAVCTCGDEVARTPEMLNRALADKGLKLSGFWGVIMPNNYVLLPGFNIDSRELENEKIKKSADRITDISLQISNKDFKTDVVRGSWSKTKTGLIYPLFKRWGIFPAKWYAKDNCIGCGKCAEVCLINNIILRDDKGNSGEKYPNSEKTSDPSNKETKFKLKPVWGDHCVSCLGCYHICPVNAIQYGGATKNKGQYFFKKLSKKNI